jgi:type II secretory pathway pseudopilin PulG
MLFDALLALSILGLLMAMLTVGLTWRRRVELRMAASRAATAQAEFALTELQQGKPAATDHLRIDRLPDAGPVPGFAWVRVTSTVSGQSQSLTGLAKTSALKPGDR